MSKQKKDGKNDQEPKKLNGESESKEKNLREKSGLTGSNKNPGNDPKKSQPTASQVPQGPRPPGPQVRPQGPPTAVPQVRPEDPKSAGFQIGSQGPSTTGSQVRPRSPQPAGSDMRAQDLQRTKSVFRPEKKIAKKKLDKSAKKIESDLRTQKSSFFPTDKEKKNFFRKKKGKKSVVTLWDDFDSDSNLSYLNEFESGSDITVINKIKPKSFISVKDEASMIALHGDLSSKAYRKPKLCCSVRLIFTITNFIVLFNLFYIVVGLSVNVLCMVKNDSIENPSKGICQSGEYLKEFSWSPVLKGWIMSGVFYGFIFGPFAGGLLSYKVGGKAVMMIGIIAAGTFHILAPEGARLTPVLLFVFRLFAGFFGGFIIPAFYGMAARWIVPEETQLLVGGALVGVQVSTIVNFPFTSIVCEYLGWPWVFYLFGFWAVGFGFMCHFLIYNTPDDCPYVSTEELEYLKFRIPTPKKLTIPWKKILMSPPIYAYIILHCCAGYFYITLVLSIPLYLKEVHRITLPLNGFLSATPYMGSCFLRILLSLTFEPLRLRLKLKKNTIRKIFVFFGAFGASTFLLTSTFITCKYRYLALACLICAVTCFEMVLTGGYMLSLLDICPSYANVVTGIANTIANSSGIISPVLTGYFTSSETREGWNIVFYMNACILSFGATFYLIFGQNHLQSWGLGSKINDLTLMPSLRSIP